MEPIFAVPKPVVLGLLLLVGIGLLMTPMLRYVIIGWRAKRNDILNSLGADARLLYFNMFSPTDVHSQASANEAFEKLYKHWYGRRFFIAPGLLFFLTGSMTVAAVAFTGLHRFGYAANPVFDLPDTALAALAGAYLWVAHDHIFRARRLDFAPSDPLWGALRLSVAIPMGYAISAVAAESAGPFMAFALGAFPLSELLSIFKRISQDRLKIGASSEDESKGIGVLQGVNKSIVERLTNEDITSVLQMAYCDPVRLVMRANLTFIFVTDCASQSLAWIFFEDKMNILRPFGIRGAVEVKNFVHAYEDGAPAQKQLAGSVLTEIAKALGQSPECLLYVFRQIAEDPYTKFLSNVWGYTGEAAAALPSEPGARAALRFPFWQGKRSA